MVVGEHGKSNPSPEIEVLFFAQAKVLAQRASVRLSHIEHETVQGLRARLLNELPQLQSLLPHCMFAINEQYADEQFPIPAAAKVACIPPVSGG